MNNYTTSSANSNDEVDFFFVGPLSYISCLACFVARLGLDQNGI